MKAVLLSASLLLASPVFAAERLQVEDCAKMGIDLTTVTEMRSFGNGTMNVFATNTEEPAATPVGLAVVVHRGSSLPDFESICRYVSGLSGIDIKTAKSAYDSKTNVLSLEIAGRKMMVDAEYRDVTVYVKVDRKADARNLVKAVWR